MSAAAPSRPLLPSASVAAYWAGGAVAALELLAYGVGGVAAWLAVSVWTALAVASALLSVAAISRSLRDDVRHRQVPAAMLVLATGGVAMWGIAGTRTVPLNMEATQQVASALQALEVPAWSYTKTAFIGYPARQYLPLALPTLIMGRGIVALRLGFALAFVGGVLVFHAGLKRLWAGSRPGSSLAALTALACLAFPCVPEVVRSYEQIAIPISLTLAATGWLLLAREHPSVANLIPLAWFGAMLGTSYTPALAAWALLLVLVLPLTGGAGKTGDEGASLRWRGVFLVILVVGAASFLTRTDALLGSKVQVTGQALPRFAEAMSMLFFSSPRAFVPAILVLPVAIFLLLSMMGRTGRTSLVVAWWTVATVAAAVVLPGFASPPPPVAIHRAVVVVPPLLAALSWTALRGADDAVRARLGRLTPVLTVLLAASAAWACVESQRLHPVTVVDRVWDDLLASSRRLGAATGKGLTVVALASEPGMHSLDDGLRYFLPQSSFSFDPGATARLVAVSGVTLVYADPAQWERLIRVLPAGAREAGVRLACSPAERCLYRLALRDGVPTQP